jgi:hypothetical protein
MKKRNVDFKQKPPVLVRLRNFNKLLAKMLNRRLKKLRKKPEWLDKENKKQIRKEKNKQNSKKPPLE